MWAEMQEQRTWDRNARINNQCEAKSARNEHGTKKRKQDKYEAEQEKQEECQTKKTKGQEQFQAKNNRKKKCQTKTKRTRGMAGQNQKGGKNGRLKARQEER